MMCNNFGLFGSAARCDGACSGGCTGSPRPDAAIVAGSRDPYGTDNPDHLAYQQQNREQGGCAGQLRLRTRHGRYRGRWFDYLLASPDEMRALAESGGWEVERVIEDDDDDYYVGVLRKG